MATLLELYQHRFGSAVKSQGNGWNGPCPLCGGTPEKSDRFMVWPERDQNMGQTCTEHHISGIWSCRQCGKGGDSIEYLMQVEGLDFRAACVELGIEKGRSPRRRAAPREPRRPDAAPMWTPQTWDAPSDTWIAYATRLLDEACESIWANAEALKWLAARGITEDAIRVYRIGYLNGEGQNAGRYRARAALGLPDKTDEKGKVRNKLFIPRGIVIPSLDDAGRVVNLRFRRPKSDYAGTDGAGGTAGNKGGWGQKYLQLEGSCKAPLLLRASGARHLTAYFVTEAELDAILIHHATGGVVGALAVRSNRNKPDAVAHALLRDAVRVAVALDYDEAGAEGVEWWESVYPQFIRWPVPEGKDPGDAVKLGVNIREWVAAALPASIALPDVEGEAERYESGRVDAFFSGMATGGEGEKTEEVFFEGFEGKESDRMPASEHLPEASDWSEADVALLQAALPSYLELSVIPKDVCRAYLLWMGKPFTFIRTGNGGWEWQYSYGWSATHREEQDAFLKFANASAPLWDWLCGHKDLEITSRNLLNIWG